jgi:hypothetical protein
MRPEPTSLVPAGDLGRIIKERDRRILIIVVCGLVLVTLTAVGSSYFIARNFAKAGRAQATASSAKRTSNVILDCLNNATTAGAGACLKKALDLRPGAKGAAGRRGSQGPKGPAGADWADGSAWSSWSGGAGWSSGREGREG